MTGSWIRSTSVLAAAASKILGGHRECGTWLTSGIRENSPEIRARIYETLEWAGLKIGATKNEQTMDRGGLISADDYRLLAYAIPADEELLIAPTRFVSSSASPIPPDPDCLR